MHGPDGRDYQNRIIYIEIVKPSRLVYKHGGDEGAEPVRFQTEVAFDSLGASGTQTRVTMRSIFSSAEERDFVIKTYNAVEGGKQHLANLADYLQNLSEGEAHEPPFSTSRVLRAPRDRVWQAWTDREELFRWFGPKGANLSHAELDLRPGGSFHYGVNHPSGMTIWGRWVFREISPSHKLVFLSCFSDPDGRIARAPFPGFESFPAEMLSTVSFAEHAGIGKGTLVTYEAQPFQASQEELDFFRSCHDSLRQGWGGTLEQLADYLGA
jgi:uncharacterized protein YndB with AHSA1/START domain